MSVQRTGIPDCRQTWFKMVALVTFRRDSCQDGTIAVRTKKKRFRHVLFSPPQAERNPIRPRCSNLFQVASGTMASLMKFISGWFPSSSLGTSQPAKLQLGNQPGQALLASFAAASRLIVETAAQDRPFYETAQQSAPANQDRGHLLMVLPAASLISMETP